MISYAAYVGRVCVCVYTRVRFCTVTPGIFLRHDQRRHLRSVRVCIFILRCSLFRHLLPMHLSTFVNFLDRNLLFIRIRTQVVV